MISLLKYLKKKDWLFIGIAVGLIVLQVWLDLTMPDYTSKLTTAVSSGNVAMSDVWENGGMMLLCALGSMAASICCGFLCARVAASFAKSLRTDLFSKVSTFANVEMNRFSTPSLITRTTNDVVQMQSFVAMGMQVLIKAPILAVWAICKISSTSMAWTTATIVCVVIIVVMVGILVGLCYPKFKKIQKLTDNLNDVTRENVSGVRVVRAFNAEDYQENKFEKVNESVMKNQLFTSRTMGLMQPVMNLCMNGLTLAIYWIGAYLINDAEILERPEIIGNMTAFTQYALQVVMAFMLLIMIFIILPRTIVSAERIKEVLDTKPEIVDGKSSNIPQSVGEIEFKDVSFAYSDGSNVAVNNLNFKINRGETIAFIGATGSGKSTIVNLIPRFYDATDGEILIDGINVKDYKIESLRDKISIASQKAILFRGDVKSNITYGYDGDVADDDERIKKALEIAQADFIYDDEQGIHSDVAQGGTNFSGGQKQRLSIARTIFKGSEIMIFDDSFSALDYKTDMLVRKGIKENLKDTTVLIVAQRIGTIKNADKIIVLDEGKIVGMGTHEALLDSCPVYKEIALSQLSKEEL